MFYLWFVLIAFGSYLIGAWGFPQIVGSLQYARLRGPGLTLFTIVVWLAILAAAAVCVHLWLFPYRVGYYIGTALSFFATLGAGKIE